MIGRRSLLVALLPCLFFAHASLAAPLDVGTFRPPATAGGILGVDSAYTPGHLAMGASLFLDYAHDPLVYRVGSDKGAAVIRHQLEMQAAFSIAFWKRLEVGILLPVTLYQKGDAPVDVGSHHALGDLRLEAKVHLAAVPLGVGRAVAFGLALGVTFPTGTPDDSYMTGGFSYRPRAMVTFILKQVDVFAEVGAVLRPEREVGAVDVGQRLDLGVGLRVYVTHGFDLIGTLTSQIGLSGTTGSNGSPVELLLGPEYRFKKLPFDLIAAAGTGLTSAPGTPDARFVFAARYQPRPILDADHDGVPDDVDACPRDRGPRENKGCPDSDRDGDGLVDREDRCPTVAGPRDNGGCPRPAVLEPDADKDGVIDRLDRCPTEPGPTENAGCPWGDKDNDGVNDHDDKCPEVAGPVSNQGCPESDRDQDGIIDRLDKCPDEKETFNGFEDEDGCPDKGAELAVLTDKEIEIKQQVFFETGKSVINHSSDPLLAAIATILRLHPEIERIRIEGHTDSKGRRDANIRLSQARADAVREHLIREGKVTPERLTSQGFGPDKPIASNATAAGRARNRRSAFVIDPRVGESAK